MAFNEKEKQILEWGIQNGKSSTEIKEAITRFRLTGSPADQTKAPPAQTFTQETRQDIGETISAVGDILPTFQEKEAEIKSAEQRGEQGAISTEFQRAGAAAGAAARGIGGVVMGIGKAILPQEAEEAVGRVAQRFGEFISPTLVPIIEKYERLKETNPTLARNIEATLGLGALAAEITGASQVARVATATARGAASSAQYLAARGVSTVDELAAKANSLRNATQSFVVNRAADPKLRTSAERLFTLETSEIENPINLYDEFFARTKRAQADPKLDNAVEAEGSNLGKAFNKVVEQRREVGRVMAEELKKVSDVQTNVLPTIDNFVAELADSGLIYDRAQRTIRSTVRQTKMTQTDMGLLEEFGQQLQSLGSSPTIGEIDAFIGRVNGLVRDFKSARNIVETTNAERIVKNTLSSLRKQFDPDATGNEALRAYHESRQLYAELSNFMEEGAGFLGKFTQTGDFSRDASLLKSSVQSILNSGKKDWLIELENLTGYPALDRAVLAFQAMKDAGEFKGLSLLEVLSEGSVPTSKAGFTAKLIDFAVESGRRAVVGSPEEQTRAFLRGLRNQ